MLYLLELRQQFEWLKKAPLTPRAEQKQRMTFS
jgi:hypothetical protein